jgi:hypothetical protein
MCARAAAILLSATLTSALCACSSPPAAGRVAVAAADPHDAAPAGSDGVPVAKQGYLSIEDPPVIVKILSHLGLPTRAPPNRAPTEPAPYNSGFFIKQKKN